MANHESQPKPFEQEIKDNMREGAPKAGAPKKGDPTPPTPAPKDRGDSL